MIFWVGSHKTLGEKGLFSTMIHCSVLQSLPQPEFMVDAGQPAFHTLISLSCLTDALDTSQFKGLFLPTGKVLAPVDLNPDEASRPWYPNSKHLFLACFHLCDSEFLSHVSLPDWRKLALFSMVFSRLIIPTNLHYLMLLFIDMASVATIPSLRREVLDMGKPMRSVTMVWKFKNNSNLDMRVLQAAWDL